jgi:hypothetical protein
MNLSFTLVTYIKFLRDRPRGKESTEVRIKQNKGKESENSYQKLKSSRWTGTQTHTQKQNLNILTDMAVLLYMKRANVCEHR